MNRGKKLVETELLRRSAVSVVMYEGWGGLDW